MRITDRTPYALIVQHEKYFTPESVAKLKAAAERKYGAMQDLEFGTFYNCTNGDFSHLGDMRRPTVLQVYWMLRFKDFVDEFAKAVKRLQIRQTADEIKASEGLLEVSWGEAILDFLQSKFNLHSYQEAEKITIGELLIAKRAAYNVETYRRKLSQIQTAKFRKK